MGTTVFIWAAIERFGSNIISLLGTVLLSRMLLPEDFGVVGMVAIFSMIANTIIDSGLSDGLLRRSEIIDEEYDTVYVFNIVVGLCLMFVFFLISPLVSFFFHEECLKYILCVYGIGAFINSFSVTQVTKLRKSLRLKEIAQINILSVIFSLTLGFLFAYLDFSYWAIVIQQTSYSVFFFLLVRFLTKWELHFRFSKVAFKDLFGFGINLFFSFLFIQVYRNIYSFLIGKFFTPAKVGLFSQAQKLQEIPSLSLESTIIGTSYILISNETNPEKRRQLVLEYMSIFVFLNSLICFFMAGFSYQIIDFLFGEKWHGVLPYFRLLLMLAIFTSSINYLLTTLKIYHRSDLVRRLTFIEKTLLIILVFSLCPYGIEPMLICVLGFCVLSFLLHCIVVKKVSGIRFLQFISIFIKQVVICLPALFIALLIGSKISNSFLSLLIGGILFLGMLLITCRFFLRSYYDYVFSKLQFIK